MFKSHSALFQYHLIHIAVTPAIFWYLDPSNDMDPPTRRVTIISCFITFSQLIATVIYILAINRTRKHDKVDEMSTGSRYISNIAESSVVAIAAVVLFHVLIVLLGGPVIENFEGTLSLSWLLTIITITPLLTIKPSRSILYYASVPAMSTRSQTRKREKINKKLHESLVIEEDYSAWDSESFLEQLRRTNPLTSGFEALNSFQIQNFYFVIVGVWFSVFFVKLDWMQPWQEYPVTCVVSSLIFNFLSHLTHCLFLIFSNLSSVI